MVVYEDEVVGRAIIDVTQDECGIHFNLEGGWSFYLFNNFSIQCSRKGINGALLGKKILKIIDSKENIVFQLEHNVSLVMSMLDGDYNGPESMNVWAPDGRIFVSQ